MSIFECPHCDEDIDTVSRTGERRYSCGDCNMVIAHDDLAPHLDELNVIDKRDETGSGGSSSSGQSQNSGNQSGAQQDIPDQSAVTGMSDREKIYQRGTEGLKEIKKERLKNWLSNTEGVGGQTESRILMVFNRNETIHQNPHILYNLLDDELSASPSYINTMVEDIFQPERENDDLLQQQGFTPWHMRNNGGGQQMQARGGGQPFNATGNAGGSFSPGGGQTVQQQSRQSQQQAQSQPQQSEQPSQTQEPADDRASNGGGNSGITREEAAEMVREGLKAEEERSGGNRVRDSLSDATDEAIREMATNVGGLAGTVQKVIDEALVQYARDNPELVINNMGFLQKIMNATEDADDGSGGGSTQQPQSDAAVDNALSNIGGGNGGGQPQNPTQTQSQTQQTGFDNAQEPDQNSGLDDYEPPGPEGSQYTPPEQAEKPETTAEPEESTETTPEPNPKQIQNGMSAAPQSPQPEEPGATDPDRGTDALESEGQDQTQNDTSDEQPDPEDEFESIFGDVTE